MTMPYRFLNQTPVLAQALRIAGYPTVCAGVLAITDASEYDDVTKQAIGRLGVGMALLDGGAPAPVSILHEIATTSWEKYGISGVPALTTTNREALIDIVMAVSKQIIDTEIIRLSEFLATDTTLPEGWNTQGASV